MMKTGLASAQSLCEFLLQKAGHGDGSGEIALSKRTCEPHIHY